MKATIHGSKKDLEAALKEKGCSQRKGRVRSWLFGTHVPPSGENLSINLTQKEVDFFNEYDGKTVTHSSTKVVIHGDAKKVEEYTAYFRKKELEVKQEAESDDAWFLIDKELSERSNT
jgi:hypothetical protein